MSLVSLWARFAAIHCSGPESGHDLLHSETLPCAVVPRPDDDLPELFDPLDRSQDSIGMKREQGRFKPSWYVRNLKSTLGSHGMDALAVQGCSLVAVLRAASMLREASQCYRVLCQAMERTVAMLTVLQSVAQCHHQLTQLSLQRCMCARFELFSNGMRSSRLTRVLYIIPHRSAAGLVRVCKISSLSRASHGVRVS